MVSFKSLSALLMASMALAAPAAHDRRSGRKIVWHTVVKTEYVTVWPGMPQPTPKSSPVARPSTTVEVPKQESTYVAPSVVKPQSTSKAVESYVVITPTPTPTPSPSKVVVQPSPSKVEEPAEPSSTGYMAIVNEWRARLNKGQLTWDAKLEANALDTVKSSNGQMVHKLNPGTYGQVLAPGGPEDFYHCFVGGWLCERPDMPGMDGVCATASKGWYYTSTGHADILTSENYKKIACANYNGIWGCDVA